MIIIFKQSLAPILIGSISRIGVVPLISIRSFAVIQFGRLPVEGCFAVLVGGTIGQWNLEDALSHRNHVRDFLYLHDMD